MICTKAPELTCRRCVQPVATSDAQAKTHKWQEASSASRGLRSNQLVTTKWSFDLVGGGSREERAHILATGDQTYGSD